MKDKSPVRPVWWKNTFFLFGGMLLVLAILGLARGEDAIRDPGQKFETGLVMFYFVGGIAMLVNGWLTHHQATQAFEEFTGSQGSETSDSAVASD